MPTVVFPSSSARTRRTLWAVSLLALLAALLAPSSTAGAAATRPVGPEIPIAEPSHLPAVAVGANGGFVLAWTELSGDEWLVWMQRFAPDDAPLGPPRRVGFGGDPTIGLAGDGGIVVAWTSLGGASTVTTIQVRLFDAQGTPRGPAFRASRGNRAAQAALAVAADGSFIVGWTEIDSEPRFHAFVRRFGPQGETLGRPVRVHGDAERQPMLGDLALAPDGRLAAVYRSDRGEGFSFDVRLSLFAADGTPLLLGVLVSEQDLQPIDQFDPRVVRLADGRWLVVFTEHLPGDIIGTVVGRLLSDDGQPIGLDGLLLVDGSEDREHPVAAALPEGGFVVLWEDSCPSSLRPPGHCAVPENHRDGHFAGIFGRSFGADGLPAGGEFLVNVTTAGNQWTPAVAANAAGDVVAAWATFSGGHAPRLASVSARRLTAPCAGDVDTLCLGGGRFRAEVEWSDFSGNSGRGVAEPRDDLWGTFWFFDRDNLELAVKLIDGGEVNGHHWIFFGALSNIEYTLRVTDTATGRVATYRNPSGTFASRGDTTAFEDDDAFDGAAAWRPLAGPLARISPPATAGAEAGACQPAADRLCLAGDRFAVGIAWQDASGGSGTGQRLPLTGDTGAFWFFRDDNPEVAVKVLDARAVNGHFWVFYASLTNVAFQLTVTDTATGEQRIYDNPLGHFASRGDTAAFPVTPASTPAVAGRP